MSHPDEVLPEELPPPDDIVIDEEVKHETKVYGNTAGKDSFLIKALMRDTQAVKLRVEGKSYPYIAAELGYGHRGNAQRAVQRRLKRMRADCTEVVGELRQIEGTRLDIALAAIMPKVREGDTTAIATMLRIQERRAAYEGLDQPRGLKVEMAREIEGYIARLREELDDDVFERVLAIFAGEYVASEAHAPSQEESGADGAATSGSGEESAAAATGV